MKNFQEIIQYMQNKDIEELWNSHFGLRLNYDEEKEKLFLESTNNYGNNWVDLSTCNNTVKARTLQAYNKGYFKSPKSNNPEEVSFVNEVIDYMIRNNLHVLSNGDNKLELLNSNLYSYVKTDSIKKINKRLFVNCFDNVKYSVIQSWKSGDFHLKRKPIVESDDDDDVFKKQTLREFGDKDSEGFPSPPTVDEEKVSNYRQIKEAVDASSDQSWAKVAAIEDEVGFKPIKLPTIQETKEPVEEPVEEEDDEANRLRILLKYSAKEITKGDMSIHYLMTALSLNLDYVKAPIIQFPGMVETSKEVLQDLENGTDPKSLIPKLFKAYYKEMGENMSD